MDWTGYPGASDVQPCPACGSPNGWPCSDCGFKVAGMEPTTPRPLVTPAPTSETYEAWQRETNMQLAEWDAAALTREEFE